MKKQKAKQILNTHRIRRILLICLVVIAVIVILPKLLLFVMRKRIVVSKQVNLEEAIESLKKSYTIGVCQNGDVEFTPGIHLMDGSTFTYDSEGYLLWGWDILGQRETYSFRGIKRIITGKKIGCELSEVEFYRNEKMKTFF